MAVVPLRPVPLKQGPIPAEDVPASAPTPAAAKASKSQQQARTPGASQPPRNKQRDLVAPRAGAGYGNGAGIGKVFYFLDQMRVEVTEADKTIKSLQKDLKFMVSIWFEIEVGRNFQSFWFSLDVNTRFYCIWFLRGRKTKRWKRGIETWKKGFAKNRR